MIINAIKKYNNILVFSTFVLCLFFVSISIEYSKYQELVDEEVFEANVEVLNIYEKENYNVLKLTNNDFTFFTNFEKNDEITQSDYLNIAFLTNKIDFIDYLKGFYTKTIYYERLGNTNKLSNRLALLSDSQHHNEMTKQVYKALFLAIPVNSNLRDTFNNYGISHLIALSGFHLAVLSFLLYWIFFFPYSFFHKRYFPFRNRKFDLLLITMLFLFLYLLLTSVVPSLLRAFVLMALGIYFLRYNIKVFSFVTLGMVFLIVVSLFPKYLFSLSFWFSISGVFYIYLFIEYFKDMKSKVMQVLFFNFWIYLSMNPIVHFFFPLTTYEQLISPFITIFFTVFYPLSLFLHFIGEGSLFDEYLLMFLNKEFYSFEVSTSTWFFILYIVISLFSIVNKKALYVLNFLLFGFTFYLYL